MAENKTVEIEGNTYYLRDGNVYKKHGNGEKIVGNPATIAKVKAALEG